MSPRNVFPFSQAQADRVWNAPQKAGTEELRRLCRFIQPFAEFAHHSRAALLAEIESWNEPERETSTTQAREAQRATLVEELHLLARTVLDLEYSSEEANEAERELFARLDVDRQPWADEFHAFKYKATTEELIGFALDRAGMAHPDLPRAPIALRPPRSAEEYQTEVAQSALDVAIAHIQKELGVTSGDLAGQVFSDHLVLELLKTYIRSEIQHMGVCEGLRLAVNKFDERNAQLSPNERLDDSPELARARAFLQKATEV